MVVLYEFGSETAHLLDLIDLCVLAVKGWMGASFLFPSLALGTGKKVATLLSPCRYMIRSSSYIEGGPKRTDGCSPPPPEKSDRKKDEGLFTFFLDSLSLSQERTIDAGVTLEKIPCRSPGDPPEVRACNYVACKDISCAANREESLFPPSS